MPRLSKWARDPGDVLPDSGPIVHSTFHVGTGREAVYDVCQAIMTNGELVSPRGSLTRELLNVRIVLDEPWDALPTGINRPKLNPAIGAVEALQNLAARSFLPLFKKMVPGSAKWDDDVPTYGDRLGDQLEMCYWALSADPSSRQAVALIWRDDDIIAGQAHNLCTIGLQFLLRDGLLHCHTTMRSNDAWWGLCYDLFQFTQVQATMANALGVDMGAYVHDAGSMHLYERHWETALDLEQPDVYAGDLLPVFGLGMRGMAWPEVQSRARLLATGSKPAGATSSELWYAETLRPYIDQLTTYDRWPDGAPT